MWGWGLGIGDWGLGIGPNPPSPIPINQILKIKLDYYQIKMKIIKLSNISFNKNIYEKNIN